MEKYHDKLKKIMDEYVHLVYTYTKNFPRDEIYGVTSQLRRSVLSVILNYIEGYARISAGAHNNFLKISYGSLKESEYLIKFSLDEKYINNEEYLVALKYSNEIGAMLWPIINK